jgi:ferredoxin, 2Fe-2S
MSIMHFVHTDNQITTIDIPIGKSIMNICKDHGFSEIVAECGGAALCATCHVYIDEGQVDFFAPPNAIETQLLEFVVSERKPTSRLSCQLVVHEKCHDLKIYFPPEQI